MEYWQTQPRKASLGQTFSNAVGAGLQQGGQLMQEHQKKQQMQKENETAAKLGLDLSGISDPKTRQQMLGVALQGINQQKLESVKQQGKQQQLQEKQDYISKLFSGQNKQNIDQDNPKSQMKNQSQGSNEEGFDPSKLTDSDILELSAMDPVLGREARMAKDSALKQKNVKEKMDFEREKIGRHEKFETGKIGRAEETAISKPILTEMSQIRKNIPLQEQAILDIKEASPKVNALDYFADVTGFEPLRSAEGAKLKTGIKDFFLSDLTRVGARPNQWIEQQLADALPKIGRSTEANLITAEGLQFKVDLAKKRVDIIDKLAEQDREKFGYVKADIDSRAYDKMKKYVVDRQKELQDNIKKIKASNKSKKEYTKMISPEGSVYDVQSNDIDEALEHGYTIQ